jgi:alpha-amylase/alpha-mannosidase (GH57 family)
VTTLCFLWHMHQPFYKNLWTGEYKLPWTRLHALKDYAGMVEILAEFPPIRQTFNLVPSMLLQIEEYANGKASDPFLVCAELPAEDLTAAQRAFVLKYFFQITKKRVFERYPRYAELFDCRTQLSTRDLRDLQVLNQLAWFDEDLLVRDHELKELVKKGQNYSRDDQILVVRKERAALQRVLPVYREFARHGQIEISTTPFYHPILPLLCDSQIAAESHPGVRLPTRFQYPGDAREQLQRARSYMREKLAVDPAGLWPSEGSVSDEALALAAECGFFWGATDNGVLARTLGRDAGPVETYRAYVWTQHDRELRMLFRDHYLSDLIGFEYQNMSASDAARHFLSRIRENTQGRDALVPIILDGENAWEWYERNGRPFLRELYGRISDDRELQAATISEALSFHQAQPLDHIFPGSWINANFDIWIGAEEDNEAWERLGEARRMYDSKRDSVSENARALAYEELLIAEGSDWCWWYGPQHVSDNRAEFDELYRDHLSNVYRALGEPPPANLSQPILKEQEGPLSAPPSNPLNVTLDGEITSAFEWMGAGHYRPDLRQGAMHSSLSSLSGPREIFYGTDASNLFVRVDGAGEAAVGIEFDTGPAQVQTARGHIVELKTPRSSDKFRVVVSHNGLGAAMFPPEGWFEV